MHIVLAPNAFKECLSAPAVAQAMARGVNAAAPDAETRCVPMADGGDGTMESLVAARQGRMAEVTVHDPLMRPVASRYGLIDNDSVAVIEMALASGLWMLREDERNPLRTTTFGTGDLIRHALQRGCRQIIIGIGGSATTDGGIGMAAALGYAFYDDRGERLDAVGGSLPRIARIDSSAVIPELQNASLVIASDVTNPLAGDNGAARVFGPQKGATPEMVETLDQGLLHLDSCWQETFGRSFADIPGAGAAGGLGAGLMAFASAKVRSGFELVAETAHLDEALQHADLVLTGEGKLDEQTRFGKVPAGVGNLAKRYNVPCIALAGKWEGDLSGLHQEGIQAIFAIQPGPVSLETAMNQADEFLAATAEQVIRLWRLHR